jgi:hypothetical protein
VLLRAIPRSNHSFQPFPVARTKPDFYPFSHPARLAHPPDGWNHSSASIH